MRTASIFVQWRSTSQQSTTTQHKKVQYLERSFSPGPEEPDRWSQQGAGLVEVIFHSLEVIKEGTLIEVQNHTIFYDASHPFYEHNF